MKKNSTYVMLSLLAVLLFSCQTDFENLNKTDTSSDSNAQARIATSNNADQLLILGKQLTNPYTVAVMQKAYLNLKKNSTIIPAMMIVANYSYVRILPHNETEYLTITKDDNLDLYNYPLDYEITQNGNSYKDISVGANPYPWYYCVIPSTYKFSTTLQVETLAKLYLPKGNGNKTSGMMVKGMAIGGTTVSDNILDALETEALRLTGNATVKGGRAASWIPKGTIKAWNNLKKYNFKTRTYKDSSGLVPVVGCKVRTRRWFSTETTLTNAEGYYNIGVSYSNPANFSIEWEREGFSILDGSLGGQAYFNGPKQESDWNLDIISGKSLLYASAHKAAYDYYYNNTLGVKIPTKGYPIGIGVYDKTKNGVLGDYSVFRSYIFYPDIRIFKDADIATPSKTYSTTIHELCHASHKDMMTAVQFYLTDDKIIESWAKTVEAAFTEREYPIMSNSIRLQWLDSSVSAHLNYMKNGYTPMFIDCLDTFNQRIENKNSSNYAPDKVSGFSLVELEGIVKNSRTMDGLKSNLKAKNKSTASATDIDALVNFYKNL